MDLKLGPIFLNYNLRIFLRMISELFEMVKIYQVMIMWTLSGSHNDSFDNTRSIE